MKDTTIVLLWVVIIGLLLGEHALNNNYQIDCNGYIERRAKIGYSWVLFLPIILLACYGKARADTPLYLLIYSRLPGTFSEGIDYLRNVGWSGVGWYTFEIFIKVITGGKEILFRIILSLLHAIPIIKVLRKHSANYGFSVFLFVAFGCHLAWMMNGLRQFLACVLIFSATNLMLEGNKIRLILIILLASTIHTSALIMLPVVFVVNGKAWNKKTLFFLVLAIGAAFIFSRYEGLFDQLLVGTEYSGMMTSAQEMGDDGANPIRVLVVAVPTVMSFFYIRILKHEISPMINLCINMSIITLAINIIAMVTSGVMVGRLPIYTHLYNLILIPELLEKMFTENSYTFVKTIVSILFIVFYAVECGF